MITLPKSGLDMAAIGQLRLTDIGIQREAYRRDELHISDGLFANGYWVELTSLNVVT